jgi:hypothetical protein
MRCGQCRQETLDTRWSPLCPVCYELLHQEQRREQTRPPGFDEVAWTDAPAGFEAPLGPEVP